MELIKVEYFFCLGPSRSQAIVDHDFRQVEVHYEGFSNHHDFRNCSEQTFCIIFRTPALQLAVLSTVYDKNTHDLRLPVIETNNFKPFPPAGPPVPLRWAEQIRATDRQLCDICCCSCKMCAHSKGKSGDDKNAHRIGFL